MPPELNNLNLLLKAIISGLSKTTTAPEIDYDPTEAQFILRVDGRDHGRFIGRSGKVIGAINTILWFAGLRQINRTAGLTVLEPRGDRTDRRSPPFQPNPKWDRKKIGGILDTILTGIFGAKPAWIIEDQDEESVAMIQCPKAQKEFHSNPNLEEALRIFIYAAGMAQGCSLKTEIYWL